jgi:hypothetical protein
MSNVEKADQDLDFYEGVRRKVVDKITEKGIPEDPDAIRLLMQAVDGGSRTALGRKKAAADDEANRIGGSVADTIAELLRSSPTTKQKRERDSMPSVPDANLIPGEIEVGTKDVQYASMRPPVSS